MRYSGGASLRGSYGISRTEEVDCKDAHVPILIGLDRRGLE